MTGLGMQSETIITEVLLPGTRLLYLIWLPYLGPITGQMKFTPLHATKGA